ncbi:serine/threonine-protein kinase VRK1-like, partial [Trifolium medium]|nr:serine/threonine-protein kinase VRK1-like [Trifolium medium]
TQYTQQSYKVSESFPFKWINKKWREGFHVTSMATAGSRWGVVMSRNAGFSDQSLLILLDEDGDILFSELAGTKHGWHLAYELGLSKRALRD